MNDLEFKERLKALALKWNKDLKTEAIPRVKEVYDEVTRYKVGGYTGKPNDAGWKPFYMAYVVEILDENFDVEPMSLPHNNIAYEMDMPQFAEYFQSNKDLVLTDNKYKYEILREGQIFAAYIIKQKAHELFSGGFPRMIDGVHRYSIEQGNGGIKTVDYKQNELPKEKSIYERMKIFVDKEIKGKPSNVLKVAVNYAVTDFIRMVLKKTYTQDEIQTIVSTFMNDNYPQFVDAKETKRVKIILIPTQQLPLFQQTKHYPNYQ